GNNVLESPLATGASVIGRVSVADASLSLSLSLWDCRRLGASNPRRGKAAGIAGHTVRHGHSCPKEYLCPGGYSRAMRALSASCSSAVAGCVPATVLCCPFAGGCRLASFEEGMCR